MGSMRILGEIKFFKIKRLFSRFFGPKKIQLKEIKEKVKI
jgi:hypothetical protein